MNTPKQKWLLISHAFNMDGRAASQTITDKIPALTEAGIELTVISAVTGRKDTALRHHQVLPWGAAALRFDLRHRLRRAFGKDWRYRLLMLSFSLLAAPFLVLEKLLVGLQNHWSWAPAAYFRARSLLKREHYDVLYTTAGMYSAHLAGLWLKRATGIKWIAEVHDPLVQRLSADDLGQGPRKTRDEAFQAWLEQRLCSEADHVWWFTQGALDMAHARNPQLGDKGFQVLPGALPPVSDARHASGATLRLCHFGSLSPTRSARHLLEGILHLRERDPGALANFELHIFGGMLDTPARALLGHPLLQNTVVEHGRLERDPRTGKSGREQVINEMHRADVLLLLHGEHAGCSEYIPSKLYEYLFTERPLLALVHDNPQLEALVREHGGYVASACDIPQIARALAAMHTDWAAHALPAAGGAARTVKACVETVLATVAAAPTPTSRPQPTATPQ